MVNVHKKSKLQAKYISQNVASLRCVIQYTEKQDGGEHMPVWHTKTRHLQRHIQKYFIYKSHFFLQNRKTILARHIRTELRKKQKNG